MTVLICLICVTWPYSWRILVSVFDNSEWFLFHFSDIESNVGRLKDMKADKVDIQVRNIEYGGQDTAVGQIDVAMFKDKQRILSLK